MGEPRRHLEHKISLHQAASEVRYLVISNNGSTTECNGVSELSFAPHRVAVFATKHTPAKVARNASRVAVGCALVSRVARPALALAAGLPLLQSLSRTTNHQLRGAFFFERGCGLLVTSRHTHKNNRARRVLVAFKF
jgi:hypothetical protein